MSAVTPPDRVATFRASMEALAERIKDLILALPPLELLGYLWSQQMLHAMLAQESDPNRQDAAAKGAMGYEPRQEVLLALEYVHSVHSCYASALPADTALDEGTVASLLQACGELRGATLGYVIASTTAVTDGVFGPATAKVEFFAKNAWAFVRGNRYQQLEGEFLNFVLTPHDGVLQEVYGVTAAQLAAGIQQIATKMRSGMADAVLALEQGVTAADAAAQTFGVSEDEAIAQLEASGDPALRGAVQAVKDLFWGGVCNVSAHTELPAPLLDDLAYEPGSNAEFYAPGEYRGTPMRTVPARIKPLIKLNEGYFATDPFFVRDAAYRAIQRGLLIRAPHYRNEWNRRQQQLSEGALEQILEQQLAGATVLHEIYYPAADTGEWVENDTLILLDDVLVQVEAKAGVMAMHSPATDFQRHVQKVRDLVIKAYRQTQRFLEYASSAKVVPLYQRRDGRYEEVLRLELSAYRCVFPIGLTVESFAPFSSMCKELPEVQPILGRYPFFSLSIDDLFILRRLLPTAGELFHYLQVRQQVAAIRPAFIFDEIDHLGSYITHNRFDLTLQAHFDKGVEQIAWDGFSKVVDDYFMGDRWKAEPPPSQPMPPALTELTTTFERRRRRGWLKAQAIIRDLGHDGRERIAANLRALIPTLTEHPARWFSYADSSPVMLWLTRSEHCDSAEMIERAQIVALEGKAAFTDVLAVGFTPELRYADAAYHRVATPSVLLANYEGLVREGERLSRRTRAQQEAVRKPRPHEPCWCGSGKKYKKCHRLRDEPN